MVTGAPVGSVTTALVTTARQKRRICNQLLQTVTCVAATGVHEVSLARLDPARPGSWVGLDGSSNFYWQAEPSTAEPNAFGKKRF